MRPYSLDYTTADFDAGLTVQSISEKYHVSSKCIRDLRRLREETGQLLPRHGRPAPKPKLSSYADQLTTLVHAQADATLEELQQRLPLRAGLTTIWRALKALGFTHKKSIACGG